MEERPQAGSGVFLSAAWPQRKQFEPQRRGDAEKRFIHEGTRIRKEIQCRFLFVFIRVPWWINLLLFSASRRLCGSKSSRENKKSRDINEGPDF
jgi:hypothetical protein